MALDDLSFELYHTSDGHFVAKVGGQQYCDETAYNLGFQVGRVYSQLNPKPHGPEIQLLRKPLDQEGIDEFHQGWKMGSRNRKPFLVRE